MALYRAISLDGQFCAAFDSAAFNNSTSCLCRNTCTKAVSTCAVAGMWLVGSFWHILSIVAFLSVFCKTND